MVQRVHGFLPGQPQPAGTDGQVHTIAQRGARRGCEELPAGQPVLCDVLLADAAGTQRVLPYPDEALTAQNIQEGDTVALLPDGTLKKLRCI